MTVKVCGGRNGFLKQNLITNRTVTDIYYSAIYVGIIYASV
jgi:hypothetical protein